MRLETEKACGPSISRPATRAKMTSLRATSRPERSSRGSGSVYPRDLAWATCSLHVEPGMLPAETFSGMKLLNRKLRLPLITPSIFLTRSPVAMSSLSVDMIGMPAPTEDSW